MSRISKTYPVQSSQVVCFGPTNDGNPKEHRFIQMDTNTNGYHHCYHLLVASIPNHQAYSPSMGPYTYPSHRSQPCHQRHPRQSCLPLPVGRAPLVGPGLGPVQRLAAGAPAEDEDLTPGVFLTRALMAPWHFEGTR